MTMTTTMAASFAADDRKFSVCASDRYFFDIIDKSLALLSRSKNTMNTEFTRNTGIENKKPLN